MTNSGLIPDISPSIWLGEQIEYSVVNETGNWRPYVTRHERQKDPLETMACVSFSCNNALETQYKFYGIDVNFSDRALAKMSNTQVNGNTLEAVNNTARHIGLLLESQWPNEPKATTWADYYKPIPTTLQPVPQSFQYAWTAVDVPNLKKELKQSPLQITIVAPHPNHAVTLLHIEGDKAYIQDHYNYQIRQISVSSIAVALKVVLRKPMNNVVIYKNGSEYQIAHKAKSEEGLAQQLFDAGAGHLLTSDGKPNFAEIDKIAVSL